MNPRWVPPHILIMTMLIFGTVIVSIAQAAPADRGHVMAKFLMWWMYVTAMANRA